MDEFVETKFDVTNKTLETDRLILRQWHLSDVNDLFEYASVAGVGEMAGWQAHKDLEHSKAILFNFLISRSVYAIQLKSNNKVIGSLGVEELHINHLGNEFKNLKGREIGYVLSKEYWGLGIMAEAVDKVVEHIFNELDFDFLMCAHFKGNNQSKRVIEKTGFNFYKEAEISTIFNENEKTLIYIMYNPKRNY